MRRSGKHYMQHASQVKLLLSIMKARDMRRRQREAHDPLAIVTTHKGCDIYAVVSRHVGSSPLRMSVACRIGQSAYPALSRRTSMFQG
jgi:hypothetical protein